MQRRPDSWLVSASVRLYNLLVLAYPKKFTHAYRHPMLQLFRDCCRSAYTTRGTIGLLGLWVRTVGDLAASIPKEHAAARTQRPTPSPPQPVVAPIAVRVSTERPSFDQFTKRASLVVGLAVQEARAFKHPYIGPEHLLLGLINQPAGSVAAKALDDLGVKLPHARAAVEFLVGLGHEQPVADQPLTATAQRILADAEREAQRLNQQYVGPEHLLLSIVSRPESVAASVLEIMGVSLESVRAAVIRMVRPG